MGSTSYIAEDFKHGGNLIMGEFVIIEPDVIVGDNVKIGHRVTLKSGTRMGNNSIIDDHCITTGACYIGNNVNIRTGAVVSKSTLIADWCFIGPGPTTNHTKNVPHGRTGRIPNVQLLTYIGYGSIIGSMVSMVAGLRIGPQVIIGAGAVVVNDLTERGVYVGFPARKKNDLPDSYVMEEPEGAGKMYLTNEIMDHFRKYMPDLNLDKYKDEISL